MFDPYKDGECLGVPVTLKKHPSLDLCQLHAMHGQMIQTSCDGLVTKVLGRRSESCPFKPHYYQAATVGPLSKTPNSQSLKMMLCCDCELLWIKASTKY